MAEFTQSGCAHQYTVGAGDTVDLKAEYLIVWVHHTGGGDCSVAPGEAFGSSGTRLYGSAGALTANTWTRVSPDFPTRYIQLAAAGTVTVHRCNLAGRRGG